MITYILEIKVNEKTAKKWRSWNMSTLIKKINRLKINIPPYIRGYASPDLEKEIKYYIGKLTTGKINIRLFEETKKFTYIECIINNKGDIIKDDNHCY